MSNRLNIHVRNAPTKEHVHLGVDIAGLFDEDFENRFGYDNGVVYAYPIGSAYVYRTATKTTVVWQHGPDE